MEAKLEEAIQKVRRGRVGFSFSESDLAVKCIDKQKKQVDGLLDLIKELYPENRHDHDCFHSACTLCQWEKKDNDKLQQKIDKVMKID